MNINRVLSLLFIIILSACSNRHFEVNDFFGIEMNPKEERSFRIVSYDPGKGASYFSTPNMNTLIFAWAEVTDKNIFFKIVNHSPEPIKASFVNDQFSIVLKTGEEFFIEKGRAVDYAVNNEIGTNKEIDFRFDLPKRFWETIGMTKPQSSNESYTKDFWTGLNTVNMLKENIRYIKIVLGGQTTIILKEVPQSIHSE